MRNVDHFNLRVKLKLLCFRKVFFQYNKYQRLNSVAVNSLDFHGDNQGRVQILARTHFENNFFSLSIRGHQLHTSLKVQPQKSLFFKHSVERESHKHLRRGAFIKSYLLIVVLRFIEQCPILAITSFASFIVYFLQLFLKSPSPKVVYTILQLTCYSPFCVGIIVF